MMDIHQILKQLPHRYPILLVDRVLEIEKGVRIKAIKNVTINEPQFMGHFPERPVMPGVLLIEAMAQVGGVLVFKSGGTVGKTIMYLTGVEEAKFRKPVVPGDQLRLEIDVLKKRPPFWKMQGKAFVDNEVVCEAVVTAMVMEDKAEAQ